MQDFFPRALILSLQAEHKSENLSLTHMEGAVTSQHTWDVLSHQRNMKHALSVPMPPAGERQGKFTVQGGKHQKLWERLIYYICHTQLQSAVIQHIHCLLSSDRKEPIAQAQN